MIIVATLSDLDELSKLENSVFDEKNYPLSKQAFRRFIKNEKVFIYLENKKIAGYILVIEYKNSVRIYSIAVSNEHRGKGISKHLVNFIIDKYKDKKSIILEVRVDNKIAIKLYENYGFLKKEILKNYYSDGTDGIKMSLKL